jgi:hypothetical protein
LPQNAKGPVSGPPLLHHPHCFEMARLQLRHKYRKISGGL